MTGLPGWLRGDLGIVLLVEAALVAVVVAWVLWRPRHLAGAGGPRFLRAPWAQALLHDPRRQLLAVAALAIVPRALLLPVLGPPPAMVHDEHSLLLQARTLAAGRLTNPTHPHWEHFENVHINQQPTYSSIYFPGRGFPMAVGIWLAGHPWAGVWLGMVLMAVAVTWMLQAWVAPPLALLGGVLVVARYGLFSYWINSYWGGGVTAAGGALVLGALPRLWRGTRVRDAALLGLGLLILMTTRPYEGLLLAAPVGLALLWRFAGPARPSPGITLRRLVLPVVPFVAAGVVLSGLYFWRVTGSPMKTPYEVNRAAYALAPALLVSAAYPEPEYRLPRMRQFYEWEATNHQRRNSLRGLATVLVTRLRQLWIFYLGPALTLPFLVGLMQFRDRRIIFLGALGLTFLAGYLIETWGFAHYASPLLAPVYAVVLIGLERLSRWEWHGEPVGRALARALPAAAVAVLLLPLSQVLWGWPRLDGQQGKHACCALSSSMPREQIRERLLGLEGPDLVFVRYSPRHSFHNEWVYNDPDIDRAAVVWAHDLGPARNDALRRYFAGHQSWLVEVDRHHEQVQPYPGTGSTALAAPPSREERPARP